MFGQSVVNRVYGPQFVNYAWGTFHAFCPHSIWIRDREVMLCVRGNQQTSRAGFNFEQQASLFVEKDYFRHKHFVRLL